MNYAPATDQLMGDEVSVSGISEDIYEDTEVAAVQPATAQQGSPVTVILAPVGSSVPSLQSTPVGNTTVNYADGFATVLPAPAGLTYVPGSIKVTGGDSITEGVATAEYCTAAGTGCDATINSGNYKTTYPYIELELPSSDHVNGGLNFTLPTVTAQFTATGASGHLQREHLGVPAQHQRDGPDRRHPERGFRRVSDQRATPAHRRTLPRWRWVPPRSTKRDRADHHIGCEYDLQGRQRGKLHGDDHREPHAGHLRERAPCLQA